MDGACRGVTFNRLADFRERRLRRPARGQQQPEAPVARLIVGAGQHQVAEAREPHEGVALGAEGHAEPRHLLQAPGDQCHAGVGAEAEPVRQPGADGQRVLHGAADLHAHDVGGGVGAEICRRQLMRQRPGIRRVGRRHRHGRGQPRADLASEGRSRQDCDPAFGTQHLARDLVRQLQAPALEALGGPRDVHVGREMRRELGEQRAERVARHDDQHVARAGERCLQIRLDLQRIGKLRAGEIALIAAAHRHVGEPLAVAAPQPHRPAAARELDGECRTPRTRAEHGDGYVTQCSCGHLNSPAWGLGVSGARQLAAPCAWLAA
jgi:hypothetical protein